MVRICSRSSFTQTTHILFIFFLLALDFTVYTLPALQGTLYSSMVNSSEMQK